MELNIPAIKGIGDSLIYLVDRYASARPTAGVSIYDIDFVPLPGVDPHPRGAGLTYIDHLTHNVHRGRMEEWASFYERLFNFREVRYFDIEGQADRAAKSKAMTSPCGKIRIPINESADDKSQIQEYLVAYRGEGIQHVALGTDDIYATVEALRGAERRVPGHARHLLRSARRAPAGPRARTPSGCARNRILLDGAPAKGEMLLQIFTATVIGPIFFEIIQRKGNQGFGEGNFRALFESIEQDQIRRGVLK